MKPSRDAARAGRVAVAVAVLCVASACRAPTDPRRPEARGDADRGRALMLDYGCGTCHSIPHVPGARGRVGPPLWAMAERGYIAGVLPNTEDAMVRWLQDPPGVDPRTVMPFMNVTDQDARDMTAYLYTLHAEPVAIRLVRGYIERALGRQIAEPGGLGTGELR